jgi:S-formylglutathione hydrolase
MKKIAEHVSFGGLVQYHEHHSDVCKSKMTFAIYLPGLAQKQTVPAIYWLSGLTCTHENFITKAGAQRYANEQGVALIIPDTSPRNLDINGADQIYHVGYGAGFYVDATEKPWSEHFKMYSYVLDELPALCEQHLPIIPGHASIMGHSMGGHGAMILALNNPDRYLSVSAFAPACMPSTSEWGRKALMTYLGEDESTWARYDSSLLVKSVNTRQPILVDQGADDDLLTLRLNVTKFKTICDEVGYPLTLRMQPGYDHSYYFVASFIEDHIAYHSKHLK